MDGETTRRQCPISALVPNPLSFGFKPMASPLTAVGKSCGHPWVLGNVLSSPQTNGRLWICGHTTQNTTIPKPEERGPAPQLRTFVGCCSSPSKSYSKAGTQVSVAQNHVILEGGCTHSRVGDNPLPSFTWALIGSGKLCQRH